MVLDGANRTSAFHALGVPHILAQVVAYESVELRVWHHVITNCSMDELLTTLRGIAGLSIREADLMSAPRCPGPPRGVGVYLVREFKNRCVDRRQ